MEKKDSLLPVSIFQIIAERFSFREEEISIFAETGYSFEEWCNWEAFAACQKKEGWEVTPKPQYKANGVEKSNNLGDLLITEKETRKKVFVEVGLVQDYTGNKWIPKLNKDSEKLKRIKGRNIYSLQIIVVASNHKCILENSNWQPWLSKIPIWNQSTELEKIFCPKPGGEVLVRGWIGKNTGEDNPENLPALKKPERKKLKPALG